MMENLAMHMTRYVRYRIKVIYWTGLYAGILVAPLLFAKIGHQEALRGFGTEFGVALGFVGLAMLSLQFVVTGRFDWVAGLFGADAKLQAHGFAGIAAFALIVSHVTFVLIANPDNFSYFDPTENLPRALALSAVLVCLTVILVSSLWREKLRLSYEWWLLIHGVAAFLIIGIGLVHILQVGFYVSTLWQQVLWTVMIVTAMGFLVYVRLVKPWHLAKFPYRIKSITQEVDDVWTMVLEPDGHPGMQFKAGQFVWISVKGTPYTLEKNPYSFSSSDTEFGELAFTAKEAGDFSSSLKDLDWSTPVFLEGPYGAFCLSDDATGAFFVAGGIGVTPIMSMLRSAKERHDQREFVLIYANRTEDSMAFKEELDALQMDLNLEVSYVLTDPGPGWEGEEGYIDADLIEKHRRYQEGWEYMVCAPDALMDVMETTISSWGVPVQRIKSERFDFV